MTPPEVRDLSNQLLAVLADKKLRERIARQLLAMHKNQQDTDIREYELGDATCAEMDADPKLNALALEGRHITAAIAGSLYLRVDF